jgi:hypothetical protein
MEEQERIDFEKEMQQDDSLRGEMELMQHINIAFERKGEQAALDALKSVASEEELRSILSSRPKLSLRKRLIPIISTAACVLFMLFYGFSPKYSAQQLFSDYFNAEVFEIVPGRGAASPIEQENERLFSGALDLLERNQTEVINSLAYLSSIQDFEYREEAEWLLALAHLKQANRKEAMNVLSNMIENDSFYAPQAVELMRQLNQRKWF